MIHTSVLARQGWEQWVVGRFGEGGGEQVIAASRSMLYLYSVVESSVTGLQRLVCEVGHDLCATVLSLTVLSDVCVSNAGEMGRAESLLVVLDDGGRLSIYKICGRESIAGVTSQPRFRCLLMHTVSRSALRTTTPWRISCSSTHVALLLLDATLLIYQVLPRSQIEADAAFTIPEGNEVVLLPPVQVNLVSILTGRGSPEGHSRGCEWGVPRLVALDISISQSADSHCFVLAKDTLTGIHTLFRISVTAPGSNASHMLVAPAITSIRRVSFGLIGMGMGMILLLPVDLLHYDWPDLSPFLQVARDGNTVFDYGEEGDLLVDVKEALKFDAYDPLHSVGSALFGTYLPMACASTDTEEQAAPKHPAVVLVHELKYTMDTSHLWLLREDGELYSLTVSMVDGVETTAKVTNVLFTSTRATSNNVIADNSDIAITTCTFQFSSNFIIRATHIGALNTQSIGGLFLSAGFLCCVDCEGNPALHRIFALPQGHQEVVFPKLIDELQCPTYRDGRTVYPALFLLRQLTQSLNLFSLRTDDQLPEILIHESSHPVSTMIAGALVLSAPLHADYSYLLAGRTSLSVSSIVVDTTHVYTGALLQGQQLVPNTVTVHQLKFDSTCYVIVSYTVREPSQQPPGSVCLKVVETGLEFATHQSTVVFTSGNVFALQSSVCQIKLLQVTEQYVSVTPSTSTSTNIITPLYLAGYVIKTFSVTDRIACQIVRHESMDGNTYFLIFITLCSKETRRTICFEEHAPDDHDTGLSMFDFASEGAQLERQRKHRFDEDQSEDEHEDEQAHASYLIFKYSMQLEGTLESVLDCQCQNATDLTITIQSNTRVLRLSVNASPLQRLHCLEQNGESRLHILHTLPRIVLDICVHSKENGTLYYLASGKYVSFRGRELVLHSTLRTEGTTETDITQNTFTLQHSISDVFINEQWTHTSTPSLQYLPIFVATDKGLNIVYLHINEDKLIDSNSLLSLLHQNNLLGDQHTASMRHMHPLFDELQQGLGKCHVNFISGTAAILKRDSGATYLLTFITIKDCTVPDQLYQLAFQSSAPLFVTSLHVDGMVSNCLFTITSDSNFNFNIYEPLLGRLCPVVKQRKVLLEDADGLRVTCLRMLKGGYCACIVRQGSRESRRSSLVISRIMSFGYVTSDSDLHVERTMPIADIACSLSYDYPSSTLTWAEGSSFCVLDSVTKLIAQKVQEVGPTRISLPQPTDITAICCLHQDPNTICVCAANRLLIYKRFEGKVDASEALPDIVVHITSPSSTRIIVAFQKAGLTVYLYRDGKITLQLQDVVPIRVVTAIACVSADTFVVGDRLGTISVFSCTGDTRYHQISVNKKLYLYAELSVGAPVTSLTLEPRKTRGSGASTTTTVYYTLFTGEIGQVTLITDKAAFAHLLCMQEQMHAKGLRSITILPACEAHRRYRYGAYSFVNTVDLPFLTDTYRSIYTQECMSGT